MTALLTEREEWLKERQGYIGGTDIAAILGLMGNYRTPLTVWEEKTGRAKPQEQTPQMARGIRAEPFLAQTYTDLTAYELIKGEPFRHPAKPWLGVNTDYLWKTLLRIVEFKSHKHFIADKYGEEGTDQVPPPYIAQTVWQEHLTGIHECDLMVSFGWDDEHIYFIPYDAEFGCLMEERADRFWHDYVLKDCPPPITGFDADSDWLKSRFPKDSGAVCVATPEIENECLALKEARKIFDEALLEKTRVENVIKRFMQDNGNASIMQWSGGKPFTYKTDRDSVAETCDLPSLKSGHVEIYSALKQSGVIAERITRKGARKFLTPYAKE